MVAVRVLKPIQNLAPGLVHHGLLADSGIPTLFLFNCRGVRLCLLLAVPVNFKR